MEYASRGGGNSETCLELLCISRLQLSNPSLRGLKRKEHTGSVDERNPFVEKYLLIIHKDESYCVLILRRKMVFVGVIFLFLVQFNKE